MEFEKYFDSINYLINNPHWLKLKEYLEEESTRIAKLTIFEDDEKVREKNRVEARIYATIANSIEQEVAIYKSSLKERKESETQ